MKITGVEIEPIAFHAGITAPKKAAGKSLVLRLPR